MKPAIPTAYVLHRFPKISTSVSYPRTVELDWLDLIGYSERVLSVSHCPLLFSVLPDIFIRIG